MKPTKLLLAEHALVLWHHVPEFGVTFDALLERGYWAHVAKSLRVGHRIEVMAPDGAWWGNLLVRAVGPNEAAVQPLQFVQLGAAETVASADMPYEVKWRGPARQFGVVRKDDGSVVKDGFQIKEDAARWAVNHLKAMAA